jgi:steroid delta-isomerase-like uncharacterized protein
MSIEENKARDRRLVEEALNRGNLAVADELIAPDFVDHAAPPGMQHGPDGFKAAVAAFRSAFPDLHVTVEEQLAAGDRVARRMTMRGTHRGDLFGIPPTGQPMAIAGIHLVRLAGGTLVEHWGINDDVGMLQQLEVIPAPGHAGRQQSDQSSSWDRSGERSMSAEGNEAFVRRYWQEASARGVLAVIDDYFAPDVVAHPPASASPEPIRGRDAWKQFTSTQWGAFPDLTGTVEDVVTEGDRVAVRLTARGTHTGPLMGLPPTGKSVSFAGMEIFRVTGGKIVESWGQFDALSLLRQLGAIPAAEQSGD